MSAEAYLPSVERARTSGITAIKRTWMVRYDLLANEPEEIVPLAVVIVDARVLSRATQERQLQLPPQMVDDLPTTAPTLPERWEQRGRHCHLVERHESISDCDACALVPGKLPCVACGNKGKIMVGSGDQARWVPCKQCDGEGYMTCPTCEGAGNALWVRVMDHIDGIDSLRYAYVPSMMDALDLAVGDLFDVLPATLPDSLRFDPDPKKRQSAYRGDVSQQEHAFHGHTFGDALSRAAGAIRALGGSGTVIKEDVKTYAWPLLWLRYRGVVRKGDVALLTSPVTSQLCAVLT